MCVICNGGSIEDVVNRLHAQIVTRGFAIVPVGALEKGWAYTIGLINSKDHPELVIAGHPLERAVNVIDDLGAAVLAGDRLDTAGDHLVFHGVHIGTRPVHERHLRSDLLAAWHWYYSSVGRRDLAPRALQIVVPDGGFCFEHQTTQPRLDDHRHVPFDGMTRQQRRAGPTARRSGNSGASRRRRR
jgi:hypothetical protein